jgi:hypothetical protein
MVVASPFAFLATVTSGSPPDLSADFLVPAPAAVALPLTWVTPAVP